MKVWEMTEQLQVMLSWIKGFKNFESLDERRWSEEEKSQLHEIAWQLVELTRPEEEE